MNSTVKEKVLNVPFVDLKAQYASIKTEIDEAIQVLRDLVIGRKIEVETIPVKYIQSAVVAKFIKE